MKLRTLGPNQTEVELSDKIVFFSYNTPVAYTEDNKWYKTNKKWSVTTSKHINKWLENVIKVIEISQEQIDEVIK